MRDAQEKDAKGLGALWRVICRRCSTGTKMATLLGRRWTCAVASLAVAPVRRSGTKLASQLEPCCGNTASVLKADCLTT